MKGWQPSSEEILSYQRDGLLVVRSLLGKEEVERFRMAIDDSVVEYMKGRASSLEGYQRVFIQIQKVWQSNETLRELTCNKVLARAAAILGDMSTVRVFLDQIIYKQPDAEPTRAHQDAPYLSFDDDRSLNCWIAVDDTTALNGSLEYFVGSHKLGRMRLVHLDREDDLLEEFPTLKSLVIKRLDAKAGDVVFHNCYTVHRAFRNATIKPRRAYSIQYMSGGARYNGWLHPFMKPYNPVAGEVIDYDCFPVVYSDQDQG